MNTTSITYMTHNEIKLIAAQKELIRAQANHSNLVDSEAGSTAIFNAKIEILKIQNRIKELKPVSHLTYAD